MVLNESGGADGADVLIQTAAATTGSSSLVATGSSCFTSTLAASDFLSAILAEVNTTPRELQQQQLQWPSTAASDQGRPSNNESLQLSDDNCQNLFPTTLASVDLLTSSGEPQPSTPRSAKRSETKSVFVEPARRVKQRKASPRTSDMSAKSSSEALGGAAESYQQLHVSPLLHVSSSVSSSLQAVQGTTSAATASALTGCTNGESPSSTSCGDSPITDQLGGVPRVEIVEQPLSKGVRFRYECEGRFAGSIPGASSMKDNRTAPAIQIYNYAGPAAVVVSCVSGKEPYQPHPHRLVGRGCKDGVCTVKLQKVPAGPISFPHIGIQCVKKKLVISALNEREKIQVDPFNTGYDHHQKMDLKATRLCFQVFLDGPTLGFMSAQFVPLPAIVSDVIHDRAANTDLIICKLSKSSCSADGGKQIIMLCDKVNKDDIDVRFFERNSNGQDTWEAFGKFEANIDVHKAVAINFEVPPYYDKRIQECREVSLELRKRSSRETSESVRFTYKPVKCEIAGIYKKPRREYISTLFKETGLANRTRPDSLPIKEDPEILHSQRLCRPAHSSQSHQLANHNTYNEMAYHNPTTPAQHQYQHQQHDDNNNDTFRSAFSSTSCESVPFAAIAGLHNMP